MVGGGGRLLIVFRSRPPHVVFFSPPGEGGGVQREGGSAWPGEGVPGKSKGKGISLGQGVNGSRGQGVIGFGDFTFVAGSKSKGFFLSKGRVKVKAGGGLWGFLSVKGSRGHLSLVEGQTLCREGLWWAGGWGSLGVLYMCRILPFPHCIYPRPMSAGPHISLPHYIYVVIFTRSHFGIAHLGQKKKPSRQKKTKKDLHD